MLKLSIIVPIYNVEEYLPKCVDSLLNQDIPQDEYEIILVNDGSPDNCGKIADDYAAKFSNIRVIHQENGGLSAARNAGIDAAKGKYIQFVDSDDYLEPQTLGGLLKQVEENDLDVLRFNYRNVNENGDAIQTCKEPGKGVDLSGVPCGGEEFLNTRLGTACYAVMFVIKRDLFENCKFCEGIYFEDVEWTPRMLVAANRVASTNTIVYNYLVREGSITKTCDPLKIAKQIEDKITIIRTYNELSDKINNRTWIERMKSYLALSVLDSCSRCFWDKRNDIVSRLNSLNVFPLNYDEATKSGQRKMKIINHSPLLYCWLVRFSNKCKKQK